jgi:hypothetical protein
MCTICRQDQYEKAYEADFINANTSIKRRRRSRRLLTLAHTGRLGENTALVFPGMRAFLKYAEVRQYL